MRKPLIGVLGFSDGDPKANEMLAPIVQKQVDAIVTALQEDGRVDVLAATDLVHSDKTAKEYAEELRSKGVDGTIFAYGVFAFPAFSVISAHYGKGPFLLAAPFNPEWPGMVSMLAAGGGLDHEGITHFRVAGDVNDPDVLEKIVTFSKCAYVASSLNGEKFGLIGGRALGMYSTTVSMQDWQKQFGIDIEHIDQLEIVRKAEQVDETEVERAFHWLTEYVGKIEYNGRSFTPEKLKTQIRHYIATKQIIKENELDFIGVKCHYELSAHYCTECLSAAFLNDPYDWDGSHEPFVCACEADCDAALTMQILKLLTGSPVVFMDVRHWDQTNGVMEFCNCGSQSTYYADASDDFKENLKKVTLYPALDLYPGGGCHVNLQAKPGTATIARLCRRRTKEGTERYYMTIIPCEFVSLPKERESLTTKEWPHVFAKLPFDHNVFLERFGANHCHAVYGDHVDELKMICKMLDVDVEMYN